MTDLGSMVVFYNCLQSLMTDLSLNSGAVPVDRFAAKGNRRKTISFFLLF